jgi:hypothetical protein
MNITPENALEYQHKEWLTHPTTRQLLTILQKHKDSYVREMLSNAGSVEDAEYFHRLAYGLRTLEAVVTKITNTEKFIQQIKE